MDNVFVRMKKFPGNVKGSVSLDPNGDYNIYINQNLNYEQQMQALAHEVLHINNDHLRVMLPAWLCEKKLIYRRGKMRKAITLLAVLVLCIGLFGCGTTEAPTTQTITEDMLTLETPLGWERAASGDYIAYSGEVSNLDCLLLMKVTGPEEYVGYADDAYAAHDIEVGLVYSATSPVSDIVDDTWPIIGAKVNAEVYKYYTRGDDGQESYISKAFFVYERQLVKLEFVVTTVDGSAIEPLEDQSTPIFRNIVDLISI